MTGRPWAKYRGLTFAERIRTRVVERQESALVDTPCWLWQGAVSTSSRSGYGIVRAPNGGPLTTPHKVTYEDRNGPVPDGYEIDHRCAIRTCCNPDHLEAVTHAENIRRGYAHRRTHQEGTMKKLTTLAVALVATLALALPSGGAIVYNLNPSYVAPDGSKWPQKTRAGCVMMFSYGAPDGTYTIHVRNGIQQWVAGTTTKTSGPYAPGYFTTNMWPGDTNWVWISSGSNTSNEVPFNCSS